MAERLKATVSKIVVRFFRTEGSNPSLSAIFIPITTAGVKFIYFRNICITEAGGREYFRQQCRFTGAVSIYIFRILRG